MSENKYVVFKLDSEFYGLPIERVERILPEQQVARIPAAPSMLLGVFDLRGEPIPALDMRQRFDMPSRLDPSQFVVVMTDAGRCAFRVDDIDGIVVFTEDQIERESAVFGGKSHSFVSGIGKNGNRLIVILEVDTLVPNSLRPSVAKTA